MTAPMTIATIVVVCGLGMSFAGVTLRGRLLGLVMMGAGAVALLAAAGHGRPGTVWVTLLAGATLAGMLVFGRVLARRVDAATDGRDSRGIDEARR